MDFLRDVKAKLQELEELAQQQQQQAAGGGQPALFQPKGQGRPQGEFRHAVQPPQQGQREFRSAVPQQPQQGRKKQQRPQQQRPEARPAQPAPQSSIFDNLGERLDEAYLLQEILGSPRCVRGWDDD